MCEKVPKSSVTTVGNVKKVSPSAKRIMTFFFIGMVLFFFLMLEREQTITAARYCQILTDLEMQLAENSKKSDKRNHFTANNAIQHTAKAT